MGGGTLTVEGTLFGLNVVFKSLAMVLSVYLAILTTDLDNIVVSMVRSRIPYKVAFVFASTLRFFPMLSEQIRVIIEAQRLRGLAAEKMNIIQRVRVFRASGYRSSSMPWPNRSSSTSSCSPRGSAEARTATYCNETDLTRKDHIFMALLAAFFVGSALVLYFTAGVGRYGWLIY